MLLLLAQGRIQRRLDAVDYFVQGDLGFWCAIVPSVAPPPVVKTAQGTPERFDAASNLSG